MVGFTTTDQSVEEGVTAEVCIQILNGSIAGDFVGTISAELDPRTPAEITGSGFIPALCTYIS